MQVQTKEARVILAIEAIRLSCKLSRRAAAKLYDVSETTLHNRMNGMIQKADSRPANQLLTEIKEEVVVQYILDLDSQGFPPRIRDVEAMVNYILVMRGLQHVGKK
jgi:hypothetical protein